MSAATIEAALGAHHTDLYFERMASAIDDKARLLDHLVPGPVLDVGAGDGALVRLARTRGHQGLGIDAAQAAVDRSGGDVVLGTCPGLGEVVTGHWSNVIACSVLHEVASYGGPGAWIAALMEISSMLRAGGRLVVRDGLAPADGYARQRVVFADPGEGEAFFEDWRRLSEPLGPGRAAQHLRVQDGALVGPAWAVTAFLLVHAWGRESLEREAVEDYTCGDTLWEHGRRLAETTGMDLVHAESYAQPGYIEALGAKCRVEAEHEGSWSTAPWPDTNAVWVLEKPAPEQGGSTP